MMRPTALGADVVVKDLADADLVLAELSWLNGEIARRTAVATQKVDAIITESNSLSVVEIGGEKVPLNDRVKSLTAVLEKWVLKHIEKHLEGDKRSIELPHGKIGLRRNPMSVSVAEGVTEEQVENKLNGLSMNAIAKAKALLLKMVKVLGCLLGDVVTFKFSFNVSAIKKLLKDRRIERHQLTSLGLVITDPYDKAVIEPTETVTPPK